MNRNASWPPVAALAFLGLAGAHAAAQQTIPLHLEPGASVPEQAEELYRAHRSEEAFHTLAAHLEIHPDDYEARWKAARAAVSAGLLAEGEEEQNRWYRAGIVHGERARELRPEGLEGLYWLTANKGRLAIQLPPKPTADLAVEVQRLAEHMLELDPHHAGAFNALGKIHYEVMRLSSFERFLAKMFLGSEALHGKSWEEAERLHLRAVELDPAHPLYRLDLGTTYLFTERYELAAAELRRALELPHRHPGDELYKREARYYLRFAEERRKP